MTQPASTTITPKPPPPTGLTAAVGTGMIWMAVLSISTKLMSLLAQVVITARLTKSEWAIGGLALSLAAFPAVLQSAGLSNVLVHRQRAFHLWSKGASSLNALLGFVAASCIALVGLIAAPRYHAPELFDLMLFVSTTILINSLNAVPIAKLQIDLRYQTLARVGLVTSLVTATMAAAMAFYGLGPYACVAPQALAAIVNCVMLWRHSHEPISPRVGGRLWKYLFVDGSALIITNLMWAIGNFGDNIIVSLIASKEGLAVYYFAYTVSFQIVQMIAVNAQTVLFPVFSKLVDEPERQANAYVRAARLLGSLTFPLIAGLALCAPHVLTLVWDSKWNDAVPLIRVLCVGMAAFMVCIPAGSLIMAQGRFRVFMLYAIFFACHFLVMVGVGAWLKGVLGVAIGVSVHHWVAGNVGILLGIRRGGLGLRALAHIYAPGVVASLVMVAITNELIATFIPAHAGPAAWMVAETCCGAIIYALTLKLAFPSAYRDCLAQLAGLAGKFSRRFGR